MASRTTKELAVAIENLTSEVRDHREETRKGISELHDDVGELRKDMTDVKQRLTVIETQTATKKEIKEKSWTRITTYVSLLVTALAVLVAWLKP